MWRPWPVSYSRVGRFGTSLVEEIQSHGALTSLSSNRSIVVLHEFLVCVIVGSWRPP
jgi:hypothetical protein